MTADKNSFIKTNTSWFLFFVFITHGDPICFLLKKTAWKTSLTKKVLLYITKRIFLKLFLWIVFGKCRYLKSEKKKWQKLKNH